MILVYSLYTDNCGSACDQHSFLNPFGLGVIDLCTQQCAKVQHPAFYILGNLLILTLIGYLIMLSTKMKKEAK